MPDPETPPIVGNEPVVAPAVPVESPTLPPETPPETPPAEPPPEMSPEEKRDHDMRSWIGRRDAELRTEMEKRNQALLAEIQKIGGAISSTPAETPDPSTDADAWLDYKMREKENAQTTYNNTLVKTGTTLLQQDALTQNDPELAQEIAQEIIQGRVLIDRTLPPETAAAFAIASAKASVLTRRITTKANPLASNTPVTVPVGGVPPPAAPAAPAVKLPEMSDLAKVAAKRFGMTDEEVAKILK